MESKKQTNNCNYEIIANLNTKGQTEQKAVVLTTTDNIHVRPDNILGVGETSPTISEQRSHKKAASDQTDSIISVTTQLESRDTLYNSPKISTMHESIYAK